MLHDATEVIVVATEVTCLVIVRIATERVVKKKLCLGKGIFDAIFAGVSVAATVAALVTTRILSVV